MTDVTDLATGVMGSIPNTQPDPNALNVPIPPDPTLNMNVSPQLYTIGTAEVTPAISGPVVTIDSTAARGIALSLATGALRVIGTALVAHGVMTQGQVDSTIPIAAQDIVGTAVLAIGQFWAWLREQASHNRTMAAAMALPSQIVVKGQ
jgi:hypothetical protein